MHHDLEMPYYMFQDGVRFIAKYYSIECVCQHVLVFLLGNIWGFL